MDIKRSRSQIVPGLLSLTFAGLVLLAWVQRQSIFDWARLRNYQPPARVVQLADDTTMSSSTRQLFYVYHPELDDRSSFGNHCPNDGEKTIVLGCYINPRGIYLFDVNDPRLKGVEEVTAAHETLHAAYDRLSSAEKKRINKLIDQAYANVSDERIRTTITAYQQAGADVTNELHSILGTEVRSLPPELEAYYGRYFTNRLKIVGYSENYEKVFADRKAEADKYLASINEIEARLPALRTEIDNLENSLNNQYQQLERQRQTTRDADSFNAQVTAYNNQVIEYKNKINTYNNLVKEHNDLLSKYNSVALEENELIKAIDSRPSNVQSQ